MAFSECLRLAAGLILLISMPEPGLLGFMLFGRVYSKPIVAFIRLCSALMSCLLKPYIPLSRGGDFSIETWHCNRLSFIISRPRCTFSDG